MRITGFVLGSVRLAGLAAALLGALEELAVGRVRADLAARLGEKS